jgi:hypothetical protein
VSVEDFEAIRNVLAMYVQVIDDAEWDRLGEVYAPDGSYGPLNGEAHYGPEAIAEYLRGVRQLEVHTSTNHHIELSEDGVNGAGRGKWLVVLGDGRIVAGDYQDAYVKLDVGWRIYSRRSSTLAQVKTA